MDQTTRRLTSIGLAATIVAAVYTVTGDWVQAAVSFVAVVVCLLWGFWPGRVGSVTFKALVTKAELRKAGQGGTLHLTVLVEVQNDTDVAVTVRPTDPALMRVTPWREEIDIPVQVVPEMAIDPLGRMADYSHFPEGQHTIPARSEKAHYFFFSAAVRNEEEIREGGLRLRLTVCLPSPRKSLVALPPITYPLSKPPVGPPPSKASGPAPQP